MFIEAASNKRSECISSIIIISLLIFIVLTGKLLILPSIPVNQDEFHYLSQIYDFKRNALATPWQNIHVHFFQWLPMISSHEVDQVMVARVVLFLCFIGTAVFIYLLAQHFLSIGGSLFSVLCYISLPFTIINGTSFRTDTPAIFLIMISIWLFVARSHSAFANFVSGLALALAALFTIKAVFYLILFGALFLVRLWLKESAHWDWRGMIPSAWFIGTLSGGFALFHYLHGALLTSFDLAQERNFLTGTYSTFIDLSQLFPGFEYFLLALRTNPLVWLFLAGGLVIHIFDMYIQQHSRDTPSFYLLAFLLPLVSLLIYRNTFPYFYVFIMPCAMIFCGYAFDRLALSSKKVHPKVSLILLGFPAMLISLYGIASLTSLHIHGPSITTNQRELLTVIHRIFPQPVAYLDGCRMVSSFPNAGLFLSSAGMRDYLQNDAPLLTERIMNHQPLFLIANVPHLDIHSTEPQESFKGLTLHRDDWETLRSSYIHHWGPLWIMGKRFAPTNGNLKHDFVIAAGGLYTIESEADVLLDGTVYQNGMVVKLPQGKHTVEVESSSSMVTLRWGDHLYRPNSELSWQDLFLGQLL